MFNPCLIGGGITMAAKKGDFFGVPKERPVYNCATCSDRKYIFDFVQLDQPPAKGLPTGTYWMRVLCPDCGVKG